MRKRKRKVKRQSVNCASAPIGRGMESNISVWCPVQEKILSGQDIGEDFLIDRWTREEWIADIVECTPKQFERWHNCYVKVLEGFQLFRQRKIDLIRHRHVLRAEAATQLKPHLDICTEIDSIRTTMLVKCYSEVHTEADLNELYKAKNAFQDYKGTDPAVIETLSNQYSFSEREFFHTIEDRIANQELDAILAFEQSDGVEESKG